MRKEVPLAKVNRLINSGNVIMVTSGYENRANIITLAWHLPISLKPPTIGIAVACQHYSAELIRKGKEFIINIPSWSLLDKVIWCGKHSGRSLDKFKEAQLTQEPAVKLAKTPRIAECLGSIECILSDYREIGDHYIFFGEAVYADADEEMFVNDIWDAARAELIYHLGGDFFMKSSAPVERK